MLVMNYIFICNDHDTLGQLDNAVAQINEAVPPRDHVSFKELAMALAALDVSSPPKEQPADEQATDSPPSAIEETNATATAAIATRARRSSTNQ